jgi:hypothetical protein
MHSFWYIKLFPMAVKMRLLALTLLLLMHGLCAAQQASLASCLDKLASDPAFALLAPKLALGMATGATPAMLANAMLANNKERSVIAEWAAARAECLKADSRYGNAVYRPPLQAYGIDAENKVMAAAVELYDGKIPFGEFNRQRQAIAEDLREKAAQLSQRIQLQATTLEQADRQMREREQMQREIDEAERQATLARQHAEQAHAAAVARQSTRRSGADGARRHQPAPIAPNRNCFRFGSRLACTGG